MIAVSVRRGKRKLTRVRKEVWLSSGNVIFSFR
jgi:hypothetical protein